jgi:hypothetical protein
VSPRFRNLAIVAATALTLTAGVAYAATQTIERYPSWTISPADPEAKNHKGKLTFGLGGKFPDAGYTVKKSVRDGEDVELLNGADGEDWFTKDTPFGEAFGPTGPKSPEVNKVRYIKIRVEGSVATTTYTFERPTPANRFGFAVSDIDLDRLEITAKDSNGRAVAGSDFAGGVFNFCNVPAAGRPEGCEGQRSTIKPRLKSTSNGVLLTGKTDDDEEGASAWFRPTVKIKRITFVFRGARVSGSPSYRTWFAAKVKKQTDAVTG